MTSPAAEPAECADGFRGRRRRYRIGTMTIEIISKHPTLLDLAEKWLTSVGSCPPMPETGTIRLAMIGVENNERVPFIVPAEARLLERNTYTQYYAYRNLWIVILQSATVIINRSANLMVAFAYYNDLERQHYLDDFMHPLVELLRQNAVYVHHAGAVSLEGRGLMLLGQSGRGKTTLSVDLLSHGFHFMSDDRCFVWERNGGFEMTGFYEPVRYFPGNVSHIGEIAKAGDRSALPVLDNGKNQLDLYPLFREKMIGYSRLSGIIFPSFSPEESESRIEPLTAAECLVEMLPLTMVCFDRSTSRAHFDFSARMAASLPAARLIMGRDRENWHKRAADFVRLPQ